MASKRTRVLVIDDEDQIRRLLTLSLSRHGYVVESAATGNDAIGLLAESPANIVLLDLSLPDLDGLEVCREIRSWSDVPIIVVSVHGNERQKVAALDSGADDYVTKPFSMDELLARIRANLRRTTSLAQQAAVTVGPLRVDFARRLVFKDGDEIHLTPTEYDLLRVLAGNAGRVVTHRQLLREVRGAAYEGDTPILRVHMVALRQKISVERNGPGHIVTEPGVGYRLLDS